MMIYSLTQDALAIVRSGGTDELINEMGENQVKNVISTGDSTAAMKMFEKSLIPRLSADSMFYFNEALAKLRANDMNFHEEWKLYGKEKVV
jgi:hypothetical protein